MLYFLFFILFLTLCLLFLFFFYQIYTLILQPGAVYYPTTDTNVKEMLKISKLTSKDVLVDLGSGDGRILVAAARLGAKAIGYEINPFLVYKSRQLIKKLKLEKLATVKWKSFWKADFKKATIITVYLFPQLMKRLQILLGKKLNHSVRIVCNDYPFPGLNYDKKLKNIYLYYLNNTKAQIRK